MTRHRRARVYLWLAQMASYEQDDLHYAYPRPDGREVLAEGLYAVQRRCEQAARAALDAGRPGGASARSWRAMQKRAWRDFTDPGAR